MLDAFRIGIPLVAFGARIGNRRGVDLGLGRFLRGGFLAALAVFFVAGFLVLVAKFWIPSVSVSPRETSFPLRRVTQLPRVRKDSKR